MYKLIYDNLTNANSGVQRLSDMACIPLDLSNIDYQAYLKWLDGCEQQYRAETHEMMWVKTSAGNTPLPADE